MSIRQSTIWADDAETLQVKEPEASGLPWWLWPNVLAFDAPAVAVVWQRFLADTFGVPVPLLASVVLGLVVWGIYLADRWFDARRVAAKQPRHTFAANHTKLVLSLAGLAFTVAGQLAVSLPWAYLQAGVVVAALVAGYLCLVHLTKTPLNVGKEFLVGLLFAVGVAIPLIASDAELLAWLPAVAGFGLACWLNCRLIERWESSPAATGWELWLALPIAVCCVLSPWLVGIMLGVTTGLLVLLHVVRRQTGLQLARVLADVMMMTPLLTSLLHLGCN